MTKMIYVVEVEYSISSESYEVVSILNRNGEKLLPNPERVFQFKNIEKSTDELINYISELSGEPVRTIKYHINGL